jgi:hypothetical protein
MTVDQFLERIHPALEALAESRDPWENRRETFVRELGALGLSDDPLATQLVERLDSASDDERAMMLASRQFGLAEVPVEEQAVGQPGAAGAGGTEGEPGYDEQAWHAYLAQNGPAWDGSQDSWGQFRQWFLYYADERGLLEPATGLVELLDGQSAADRVSTLARYGVSIATAAETGEISDEDIDSMMRELLAEHPELAEIPAELRRELVIEAFNEVDTEG